MLRKSCQALIVTGLLAVVAVFAHTRSIAANSLLGPQLYTNDSLVCPGDSIASASREFFVSCIQDYNGVYLEGNVGTYGINSVWDSLFDPDYSNGYGDHVYQWHYFTSSGYAVMQSDGNFVLYDSTGPTAAWATQTSGYGSGAFLQIQNDGNLVVYYNTNVPIWSVF
jgi:hypothetical protein